MQCRGSLGMIRSTHPSPPHARPFVGVFQKSIPIRFINCWQYFPTETRKWLQERGRDTPTKGLVWESGLGFQVKVCQVFKACLQGIRSPAACAALTVRGSRTRRLRASVRQAVGPPPAARRRPFSLSHTHKYTHIHAQSLLGRAVFF